MTEPARMENLIRIPDTVSGLFYFLEISKQHKKEEIKDNTGRQRDDYPTKNTVQMKKPDCF
jgi:hypothetical protein